MVVSKQKIIDELTALWTNEKNQKNVFKARAYKTVIDGLKVYEGPVNNLEDLDGVPGIGKSIKEKIKEIIAHGHLAAADAIRADPKTGAYDILSNVYGIGPTKANKLIAAGIYTVADLRERVAKDPSLLHDKQKAGLKYYEDLIERIPRAEMLRHKALLDKALSPPGLGIAEHSIVGSFRREAETSGDIDLLIKFPATMTDAEQKRKFKEVIAALKAAHYVIESLAEGPKKFMAICRIAGGEKARRLDILVTPQDEYAFSLLYFTGSQKHNILMRAKALEMGWSLNEHGFTPVAGKQDGFTPVAGRQDGFTPVAGRQDGFTPAGVAGIGPFETEKAIFDFLEMAYKTPKEREI